MKKFISIITVMMVLLFVNISIAEAQSKDRKVVRWGSSQAGSAAYASLFGIAKIVNDELPDIYIEAVPAGGSIATQRMMGRGELDGAYSGAWNLTDMYENRGPYEKSPFPADAPKPYQTWWCYLAKQFAITRADRADINSWRDLAGKTIFNSVPGSAVFEVPRAALTALGVWDKIRVVNIPFTSAADALRMGTIDAVVGYANNDVLIPWLVEVDTRVDLKIIPMTGEEFEIVKEVPGFSKPSLDTERVFSQEMGAKQVHAIADFYGFHTGSNLSSDDVYRIVKVLIEKADQVANIHSTLRGYADDPLGMQVDGINTVPDIPVHPGLARYLKERGVWQDHFKIGKE